MPNPMMQEQTLAEKLPDFIQIQNHNLLVLCEQHQVRSMAIFGSAVGEHFDPRRSDLDFAVQFKQMPPAAHAEHFFALLNALHDLFKRPIDLLETSAIRNPYLRDKIQSQQVIVYGN
jgi:predicted nucleotidyltransferase